MRIVNFEQFKLLPDGIIYQIYEAHSTTGDLYRKDSGGVPSIIYEVAQTGSEAVSLEEAHKIVGGNCMEAYFEAVGLNKPIGTTRFTLDLDSAVDHLGDESNLYLVYEREDLHKLAAALLEAVDPNEAIQQNAVSFTKFANKNLADYDG